MLIHYPNKILFQKAEHVTEPPDPDMLAMMQKTLYQYDGIGLAAPQIGISKRIIALDTSKERNTYQLLINPVIISQSKTIDSQEQCLSLPGINVTIKRAQVITINYKDLDWKEYERTYCDLEAICLQHEIDHLNGILIIDRVNHLQQSKIQKQLKILRRNHSDS